MRAQPLLLVGLIAQQRRGSVSGAAGRGMNQPPPPTGHTKAARSLRRGYTKERGQCRYRPLHGSGDERELPTQVSVAAMSAMPFDRLPPPCNDQ